MNYKCWPRVLILAVVCIAAYFSVVFSEKWYQLIPTLLMVAIFVYFFFGSAIAIYLFSRYWFKKSVIKWRVTDKVYERAEVEVDSASKTVLSDPKKDRFPPKISEKKYGALACSQWGKKMESASET